MRVGDKQVIKVNDNSVVVTEIKNPVNESYTQEQLTERITFFQAEYDYWDTITPEMIEAKKAKALEKLSYLTGINEVLETGVSMELPA